MAIGDGRPDPSADPLLQQLVELTREGTIIPAFQAVHDKFHRFHAECLRLAASATSDDRALEELLRTLDAYAELFHEHHHAEDHYLFPALREVAPGLRAVVDQLADQHVHLAAQLAVVLQHAHRAQAGDRLDTVTKLTEDLWQLQGSVDEHLRFEESTTVPVIRTWTEWPT